MKNSLNDFENASNLTFVKHRTLKFLRHQYCLFLQKQEKKNCINYVRPSAWVMSDLTADIRKWNILYTKAGIM